MKPPPRRRRQHRQYNSIDVATLDEILRCGLQRMNGWQRRQHLLALDALLVWRPMPALHLAHAMLREIGPCRSSTQSNSSMLSMSFRFAKGRSDCHNMLLHQLLVSNKCLNKFGHATQLVAYEKVPSPLSPALRFCDHDVLLRMAYILQLWETSPVQDWICV